MVEMYLMKDMAEEYDYKVTLFNSILTMLAEPD